MLQNPRKTLGFKKNMVYKIPLGGGGKPYPASGLIIIISLIYSFHLRTIDHLTLKLLMICRRTTSFKT